MIPLAILIFGLLLVLVLGIALMWIAGLNSLIVWILPSMPMLVTIGSGLLIFIELLLFLGGKDDRRKARRDLGLLVPACLVSAVLWWGSAMILWR